MAAYLRVELRQRYVTLVSRRDTHCITYSQLAKRMPRARRTFTEVRAMPRNRDMLLVVVRLERREQSAGTVFKEDYIVIEESRCPGGAWLAMLTRSEAALADLR